jgi:hypothetical protein
MHRLAGFNTPRPRLAQFWGGQQRSCTDPALYTRSEGMQLWLAAGRSGENDSRFPLPPSSDRAVWTADGGLPVYQVKLDQPTLTRYIELGFPRHHIDFLHLAKMPFTATSSAILPTECSNPSQRQLSDDSSRPTRLTPAGSKLARHRIR